VRTHENYTSQGEGTYTDNHGDHATAAFVIPCMPGTTILRPSVPEEGRRRWLHTNLTRAHLDKQLDLLRELLCRYAVVLVGAELEERRTPLHVALHAANGVSDLHKTISCPLCCARCP